jgi:hypothetical protein
MKCENNNFSDSCCLPFLVVNGMTSNKLPHGISEKVVHEAMHTSNIFTQKIPSFFGVRFFKKEKKS